MRRIIALATLVLTLVSCGSTADPALYNWGGGNKSNQISPYEQAIYKVYKTGSDEDLCALIVAYENIIRKPGEIRQVPPPGICAEYGYVISLPDTGERFAKAATDKQRALFDATEDYTVFFKSYGLQLMNKEMEFYPESRPFMEKIIKKMGGSK